MIVPPDNLAEARLVTGLETHSTSTFGQIMQALEKKSDFEDEMSSQLPQSEVYNGSQVDWADVHGQQHAKRALEIAAAGGHNVILVGHHQDPVRHCWLRPIQGYCPY
ncbi:ATP-binding protein [Desulfosporosinus metallidurans]|uniref:MG(2+) CHELATASE FAMILY PROTEIN / ComM-related protein n=1 Tax=Desulfosporosinus metallidurans TaxID=1888891 RepID=A0A1Q8QJ83_9FIRM|nr:ATP-binding protein [Desulfosporosinus metallidurans]OLN27385.1 MG(2+) CHELATASE FAMILY PROTEIN / ComM-related protein [Desulfosporosinus metallidurans]